MSPNQPKTPVYSFRLDEESARRLRNAAETMNTTMTEAVKRATVALEHLQRAVPGVASVTPEESLAEWLFHEDWPSLEWSDRKQAQKRYDYRSQAAAILAGEAWAIRKAWPEAAIEIADTRPA